MKNRLITYFLLAIMSCSFTACNEKVYEEDSDSTKVVVTKRPVRTDDDEQDDRNPLPLEIIISKTDGVKIPGVNNSDILFYEIYDVNNACLGTFTEANDFINALFAQQGSLEIRIILAQDTIIKKIEISNDSIIFK